MNNSPGKDFTIYKFKNNVSKITKIKDIKQIILPNKTIGFVLAVNRTIIFGR